MRALKAKRTGVRGWAAALKVEQASVEHQLAGRIGGLPSRSGRAAARGRPKEGKEGAAGPRPGRRKERAGETGPGD